MLDQMQHILIFQLVRFSCRQDASRMLLLPLLKQQPLTRGVFRWMWLCVFDYIDVALNLPSVRTSKCSSIKTKQQNKNTQMNVHFKRAKLLKWLCGWLSVKCSANPFGPNARANHHLYMLRTKSIVCGLMLFLVCI